MHASAPRPGFTLFKRMLWLITGLLLLMIIVPITLIFVVDPNHFREPITAFITKQTGLPLKIEGDIRLKVFPWIGLNVQNITLAQAPAYGKGTFLQIDEIHLKANLREILQKNFYMESLLIKGLTVHLIKNQQGATNWQAFLKSWTHFNETDATLPSSSYSDINFSIHHFALENAQVLYEDHSQNFQIRLSPLSLQSTPSQNNYPLSGTFSANFQSAQLPAANLEGKFSGVLTENQGLFNTQLFLQLPDPTWKETAVTTTLEMTPQKVVLKDINLKNPLLHLTGDCSFPFTPSPIEFNLHLNQLDVNQLPALQIPTKKPVVKKENSSSPQKLVRLNGKLAIDKLLFNNLLFTQVKATINKPKETLNISPLTANFYQGKLHATLTHQSTHSTLQGKITQFEVQPFLRDLKNEQRLSARADLNFNLKKTSDLTGALQFHLMNGVLKGIDVKYYLNTAQQLLKKQIPSVQNYKQTVFNDLSGNLKIHDQQMDNPDLSIQASDFQATGRGALDFKAQNIAYQLQVWPTDGKYPLAIRIDGPLAQPQIKPDFDLYLATTLEKQVNKQINQLLEKAIKKTHGSTDPTLQQKLEESVEKNLKKLFRHES